MGRDLPLIGNHIGHPLTLGRCRYPLISSSSGTNNRGRGERMTQIMWPSGLSITSNWLVFFSLNKAGFWVQFLFLWSAVCRSDVGLAVGRFVKEFNITGTRHCKPSPPCRGPQIGNLFRYQTVIRSTWFTGDYWVLLPPWPQVACYGHGGVMVGEGRVKTDLTMELHNDPHEERISWFTSNENIPTT